MSDQTLSVTVKREVPFQRISDMLVSAFEGGSNYWILDVEKVKPTERLFHLDGKPEPTEFPLYEHPLNPGGAVRVRVDNDQGKPLELNGKKVFELNLESIAKGLQLMQEKHPSHMADFLDENDDADTADVFLQLCLFGEVVFG